MLFSVGYGVKADNRLVDEIVALKDGVSEVYFSWGKTPSGRNDQTRSENLTPWEAQAKQIEDLKALHKEGLKFNLLFNANCYGDKAQSRSFFESVGETVEYVGGNFSLASVTTTSPGLDSAQLPPSGLAPMSTMTLPGFMPATASSVMSSGAGRPGTDAVVMMMSFFAHCSV